MFFFLLILCWSPAFSCHSSCFFFVGSWDAQLPFILIQHPWQMSIHNLTRVHVTAGYEKVTYFWKHDRFLWCKKNKHLNVKIQSINALKTAISIKVCGLFASFVTFVSKEFSHSCDFWKGCKCLFSFLLAIMINYRSNSRASSLLFFFHC